MVVSSPVMGIWLNDPISLDGIGFSRENRSSYFLFPKPSRKMFHLVQFSAFLIERNVTTLNVDLNVFPTAKNREKGGSLDR